MNTKLYAKSPKKFAVTEMAMVLCPSARFDVSNSLKEPGLRVCYRHSESDGKCVLTLDESK